MKPQVRIYNQPDLRNPYLVIGWADAGLVGTTAINYLTDKLGAEEFGEIDLHDFSLMPYIFIKNGVIQELEYPDSNLYYWKNKKLDGDLIIWGGKPPTINHNQLANAILDVAKLFNVSRIYTMGGLYANVTHTEKPRIFAIINKSTLKSYLETYDIESGTDYHGTPSMNGLVLGLAQQRNIEGISLWGQVPSYIGDIANPQVCEAVLSTLTTMLDIDIDFAEIRAEADFTTKQINELVTYLRQQDNELDQHIDKLEKGIDVHLSEGDNQRFFREIEEFLRKQQGRKEGE